MDKSTREHLEDLQKRRRRVAFDANVQRIFKVDTPYAIKCLAEHERLTKLIDELEPPTVDLPTPSGWQQLPLV